MDAVNHAPPPANPQSGGGGMLSGIGSTIAQGISSKINVAFVMWIDIMKFPFSCLVLNFNFWQVWLLELEVQWHTGPWMLLWVLAPFNMKQ